MGLEIELKFLLKEADPGAIGALPPVRRRASGDPVVTRLVSTYYDTDDQALAEQKISFRVRRAGADWIQTVKAKGQADDGIVSREEIEHHLPTDRPDFTKLAGTDFAGHFTDEAFCHRLRPCFTTDFVRTAWWLRGDQGEVELALDRGSILAGDRSEPLLELELELKSGSRQEIVQLAEELAGHLDLEKSTVTKAQRGYNLLVT